MKKKAVKKEPPPGSPNMRAKKLNRLAAQTPLPDLSCLSKKESDYVQKLHQLLIRYWHKEISLDELQAAQRLLIAHRLCESQKSYYIRLWFGHKK